MKFTIRKFLERRNSPIMDRLRDNNFDALRLVFSSMVVLFHTGLLSRDSSLSWTSGISATFAVQAFFVVSGFLVTMSYENSPSTAGYFARRLRRIAPAYIVVVVIATFGLSTISTLSLRDYFSSHDTWRYLAFNLMLSNFSAPTLPGVFQSNAIDAVNGSLWTIKIEVAFYCLVPLIVALVRRFKPERVLATIFLLSILWKVGFDFAAASSGSELFQKLAKQIPGQLCYFAGGAWAYYRTRSGKGFNIFFAAAGVLVYGVGEGLLFMDVAAPLAVTAVVYWASVHAPKLPPAAKYGDFSYGLYLYHFPIVQTLIAVNLFHRSTLIAVSTLVAILGLCAVLSWRLIEQPILHRRLRTA